jgi:hypothetical protein
MKIEYDVDTLKPTSYKFNRDELQYVVDAIFEMTHRIHAGEFSEHSAETVMAWVADQLRNFDIHTIPMGISWGALK